MEAKNKRVVDGMKSRQKQVKQTIAKQLRNAEQPVDMFELLNVKLNKAVEKQKDEVREIERLEVRRFYIK